MSSHACSVCRHFRHVQVTQVIRARHTTLQCLHPSGRGTGEKKVFCVQMIVGILLATGLKGDTLSEGMGVGVIIMFCVFALGFAW